MQIFILIHNGLQKQCKNILLMKNIKQIVFDYILPIYFMIQLQCVVFNKLCNYRCCTSKVTQLQNVESQKLQNYRRCISEVTGLQCSI